MLQLDHIAIAADSLKAGRAYAEEVLGVPLLQGGQHGHYGTHNLLLGLEDGLYLEVIAVDPEAPSLSYPRWFDLDRFAGPPRLTNWICRTDDLAGFVRVIPEAGEIVPLARGDLQWSMSVPPSGILPYDNVFPPVIEWASSDHPAKRLPSSGCRLTRLCLCHPKADDLQGLLAPMLNDVRLTFQTGTVGLRAELDTPNGKAVLE
ncbi:MAG: VOC family protein [Pseudomonadota bacterium]